MISSSTSVGEKPNQPEAFQFPKRKFGQTNPVFRMFRRLGFVNDRGFTMTKLVIRCFAIHVKRKDAFITQGFTNWKDAAGEKNGAFPKHEWYEVCIVLD